MTPDLFHDLLKRASGLDVGAVGASAIGHAVLARQQACALPDAGTYWNHLHGSAAELQALVEAVVVSETWFFRDANAFTALARFADEDWTGTGARDTLRLLSFPCSTGEEPYSMSMTLLDAGLPADGFHIDAMDISEQALTRAQRAVYGRNSFRGASSPCRACYFQTTPGGREVRGDVRTQVSFHRGNVLDASCLPPPASYHVIFCRNLLIYFDRATQDRAVAQITRLLKPGGLLFVGPSETGILLNHGFAPAGGPMAFGLRKADPAPRPGAPRQAPPPMIAGPSRRPAPAPPAIVPAVDAAVASVSDLEHGTQLANRGRFAEAATHCEAHIRRHGPSADAFHVMGLLCDACGNADAAAKYYRKALYLNPRHEDSLVHLALLLEVRNQPSEAQRLRGRARRVAEEQRLEA